MEKTCNNPNGCSFKCLSTLNYGCSYVGYCDYQAPRDSRNISLHSYPEVECKFPPLIAIMKICNSNTPCGYCENGVCGYQKECPWQLEVK